MAVPNFVARSFQQHFVAFHGLDEVAEEEVVGDAVAPTARRRERTRTVRLDTADACASE